MDRDADDRGTSDVTRATATTMPTSDLDPFLFADVGTQTNGVELTVLSLLARLGSDPWVEAARLALLPRGAATDWLAERIATMPLSVQAVGAARDTATTLLLRLPARTTVDRAVAGAKEHESLTAKWVLALLVAAVFLGIFGTILHAPTAGSPDPTVHSGR